MATIDTNMSLVMIDPNEPLELYDGTIIKGRLEWFLYALCCLDYGNLPTPLSRIEEWANALITNELPNMEPQSRAEEFFKAILTGDTSNLPTPQSRSEVLLDKLARGENDFTNVEKIQSRYEFLLAYLIKNGGGIGNIDYVLYKFQKEDETLYNTKERPVKSAILKGQTLVNLLTRFMSSVSYLDAQYRIILNNVGNFNKITVVNKNSKPIRFSYHTNNWKHYEVPANGNILVDVPEEITTYNIFPLDTLGWESANYKSATDNIVLLHGDYTNVDIPYFEGMQSVKMPVLTTTGKNLYPFGDVNFEPTSLNTWYMSNGEKQSKWGNALTKDCGIGKWFYLEEGNYSISSESSDYILQILGEGEVPTSPGNNRSFKRGWYTIRVKSKNDILSRIQISNIQIEKNASATSYEPHKSNILTTPSDLELRGIGDVRDELDCLTGQVTERIGEIVFDGNANEQWKIDGWWANKIDTIGFEIESPAFLSDRIICETVTVSNYNGLISKDERTIAYSVKYGVVMLRLLRTELATQDLEGLKQWLSQNPIVLQYQLATPTVKTVDLTITDQGGATIPKLKTFDKITHVNVSATDILPGEVEMEVATTIGEDLSGTLYSTMEDIETKQEALKESNNAQTESINSTMMTTTEIYESLL